MRPFPPPPQTPPLEAAPSLPPCNGAPAHTPCTQEAPYAVVSVAAQAGRPPLSTAPAAAGHFHSRHTRAGGCEAATGAASLRQPPSSKANGSACFPQHPLCPQAERPSAGTPAERTEERTRQSSPIAWEQAHNWISRHWPLYSDPSRLYHRPACPRRALDMGLRPRTVVASVSRLSGQPPGLPEIYNRWWEGGNRIEGGCSSPQVKVMP